MLFHKIIGTGIPVFIIHGSNVDHRLMSGCLEPIFSDIDGYQRIYIDLPGMGQSQDITNINSSDDILKTVIQTLDALLGNTPFLLIGESYGGYLARGIIERRRNQILGVFFLCPVINTNRLHRILPSEITYQYDQEFLDTLSKEEKDEFCSMAIVANKEVYQRFISSIKPGLDTANTAFIDKIYTTQYSFSFPLETQFFRKPTLFIMAKQDTVLGYQDGLSIIDYYPKANVAIINNAGHNLQIEQPEIMEHLCLHWLKQVQESEHHHGI